MRSSTPVDLASAAPARRPRERLPNRRKSEGGAATAAGKIGGNLHFSFTYVAGPGLRAAHGAPSGLRLLNDAGNKKARRDFAERVFPNYTCGATRVNKFFDLEPKNFLP
jgi:hypothetical protein